MDANSETESQLQHKRFNEELAHMEPLRIMQATQTRTQLDKEVQARFIATDFLFSFKMDTIALDNNDENKAS